MKDVNAIVSSKNIFQRPLANICGSLQHTDKGCPHGHHVKANEMNDDWTYKAWAFIAV